MSRVVAVIPARMGSTRFPGKALHPFGGHPLLYYVWRQVSKAVSVDQVLVATDSPLIQSAAEEFGAEVVMTSRKHRTGTDRVAEAVEGITADVVINIQGDTFGLNPSLLDRVIGSMKTDRSISFATLARPISDPRERDNPNTVKLVVSAEKNALWFSRHPIPYVQQSKGKKGARLTHLAHVGVYFFRRKALKEFAGWPRTTSEKAESLEQLRILEHHRKVRVFVTRANTISIDTSSDLKKIKRL